MGADYMKIPGQFHWVTGEPIADSSPLWCKEKREPNKYNRGSDCVRLHSAYHGLFDSACGDSYGYICQKL
ncbi:hypothetical protein ACOMHN_065647 [Nucella lapillus]